MKTICSCGHAHECMPRNEPTLGWMTEIVPIPRPPAVVMSVPEFEQLLINGGLSPEIARQSVESIVAADPL